MVITFTCPFFPSTNIFIFETFQWSQEGPIWSVILLFYFSYSNYHYVFKYKFFYLHLDLISCIICIHVFNTSKWIFFCFSHIYKICNFLNQKHIWFKCVVKTNFTNLMKWTIFKKILLSNAYYSFWRRL